MTNPTLEQRAREMDFRLQSHALGLKEYGRYDPAARSDMTNADAVSCGQFLDEVRALLATFSHTGVEQAIEACAKVADEVERLQDNDHGAANTGGAAQAAAAIRATLPAQSPDDIAYAGAVQGEVTDRVEIMSVGGRVVGIGTERGGGYPITSKTVSPANVEGLVE